jgi:hypothetical protein
MKKKVGKFFFFVWKNQNNTQQKCVWQKNYNKICIFVNRRVYPEKYSLCMRMRLEFLMQNHINFILMNKKKAAENLCTEIKSGKSIILMKIDDGKY